MMRGSATRLLLLVLLVLAPILATTPCVSAQVPTTPVEQDPTTTSEALQARLDSVNADTTLPDELKASLVESLTRSLEFAKVTRQKREAAAQYQALRASAPDRLQQRQQELQQLDEQKIGPTDADPSLAELEAGFAAAQQRQKDAQQLAADLDAERTRRAARRTAIPEQLTALRKRLQELPATTPEVTGADPRLTSAKATELALERTRVQAEIDALNAEQAAYEAETELQRADGNLAARKANAAKADAEAWLAVLQPKREQVAKAAEQKAQESAQDVDNEAVAPIAEQNARLAKGVTELVARRATVEKDKAERDQDKQRLEQQRKQIEDRVTLVGATEAIGQLLRSRRTQLAEISRQHQQRTKSRRGRIIDAQLKQLDYEEQLGSLAADPAGWLREAVGGETQLAALPEGVLAQARKLRDERSDLLRQLTDGYDALVSTEIAVEATERDLTELIASYRAYVTEQVLGIRSSQPLWRFDQGALLDVIAWFGDTSRWPAVLDAALGVAGEVWPLLVFAVLLTLLALRFRFRRWLVEQGERAARGTNVAYLPTVLAAIDTALLVLPLPTMLALGGWRLARQPDTSELTKALAEALVDGGLGLCFVFAVHAVALPRGLAESHFLWQSTTVAHLRRAGPLLLLAVLPPAFGLAALEVLANDEWLGSLGALLLLVQLVILLVVAWRWLQPTTGIIGGRLRPAPTAVYRFRRLWFLLAVGTLLTLIVMTALGYEYTAQQIASRVHLTGAVIGGGVLLHAMILRGLLLERRRLQIQRAKARLEAQQSTDGGGELPPLAEIDPQSLARQTQTLLGGAIVIVVAVLLFQIWIDVLPAIGILRRFELWNIGSQAEAQWITLADVVLGAFLLAASVAAARNLPALLELLVLQRLQMPAGERAAVTTLARYAILIVGIGWSFGSIGIGWSKVQWLVAAVSVGLGFGLQEIFANFVSGLILLFERPIRVGDLITVADTTGRVTRIQIRATTIQDFARKELVVPNREFVTSHFVNWTLGDPIVRWSIPVGVAYGSDTTKALQILKQIALDSPRIQKDPEPNAYFLGFGDSTLNLELRLYIDIDTVEWHWITEIHQAIDAAFKAAGIEIAFPQRDVNLKLPASVVDYIRGGGAPRA